VTDGQYEIVLYRLLPDTDRHRFLAISAEATAWLRQRPGFLSRELLEDDGQWVDLVQWSTMDDALAAADAFGQAPEAAAFMALVELDSIRMLHPSRIVAYD
jgi:quinol monooxygenase YgiN